VRNKELIKAVAAQAKLNEREADDAVASMVEHMATALSSGEKISLPGFGSFEAKTRSARKGRNPKTGEVIVIPAQVAVVFKAGKKLKESL